MSMSSGLSRVSLISRPARRRTTCRREADMAKLRDLLLAGKRQVAVVALRGMGGVGKTTLADRAVS